MEILQWAIGLGFAFNFTLMAMMWRNTTTQLETLKVDLKGQLVAAKSEINARFDRLESRMDKFDEKLTDVDRRLCRVEGILTAKDCCMIKDDRNLKEAL